MALTLNATTNWQLQVNDMQVSATGIAIDVTFSVPGTPTNQTLKYIINPYDGSFRDPQGNTLYASTDAVEAGMVENAAALLAQANALIAQAVTDGKLVAPK